MNNTTLQIGKAYIVEGVPMVLQSIEGVRHNFTDGRYGFGRVLGTRPRHAETLANLKIAEGVNPQDILDNLKATVEAMVNFNQSK